MDKFSQRNFINSGPSTTALRMTYHVPTLPCDNPNRIPIVKLAKIYNSTTGYKNVNFDRRNMKFQVHVRDGGKRVHLGYFDTAEEAAIAYARSECGRDSADRVCDSDPKR
ncbi:hypothetical protein EMIHUDRAFT_223437 [Emiliania huxleyi CCMP1516]|uniref:AP2/ERF domain-containing protein n=2 Tax=Emiliania huxleyi TaxID=2903 RepID=A0A0D3KVT6_EMIH1|nr:hypothetical protein EMIHUDRAFT_223437 [Emiliania huxleyi CCMP1516]EOD39871.1 hypothetical protein EMIHUDRAFT_223437 [Emiliania huxleyi CCMP1516]|eukprot:XP_005792300.1 hypothetical protein EMIHUDRAFT_223437 [Emiliania huxleyi CCMP1516]